MSCPSCLNLLRFPVNLGCGHSMCKVCILSGDEAERERFATHPSSSSGSTSRHGRSGSASSGAGRHIRAACRICSAESTFTSEAALVVDGDLQAMVDVLQGLRVADEPCMRCGAPSAATVSCAECAATMCDRCSSLVHEGALRGHTLTAHSHGSLDPSLHPQPCQVSGHQHYRRELYCTDCRTFLCVLCAQQLATHKGHNVVTAADAASVERKRLVECVHAAEAFRGELRATVLQIDAVADATAHHSREEVRVFEETMNGLISTIQRRRDELVASARAAAAAEVGALKESRDRIFSLATRLNETVAESSKALRHNSAVAIVTSAAAMEDAVLRWDPIVVPSAACPAFVFPQYADVVAILGRVAVQPTAITAIEAGLDAHHLGRTLQFMRGGGGAGGGVAVGSGRPPQQLTAITVHTQNGGGGRPPLHTPANPRSLLPEFDGATSALHASPHADGLTRPPPPPPGPSQHFLSLGSVGGPSANGGGFATEREAAMAGGILNASLVAQAPRMNLTDPSGGVLIDPSAILQRRGGGATAGPSSALPSPHLFTGQQHQQQFKFVKSTFGGLQFLNGGRTVASNALPQQADDGTREIGGWETAMCDALLVAGRHYFELHLDRYGGGGIGNSGYDNGHNVIVGLVFDGSYGLCDAIGEDNNSVGIDLGAGTKCIGGDYSLPYMPAALQQPQQHQHQPQYRGGTAVREGDVIGVDVDFDKQTLSLYHNGRHLGPAFTGLCRPCYPALSLLGAQQVTLMFPMQRPL